MVCVLCCVVLDGVGWVGVGFGFGFGCAVQFGESLNLSEFVTDEKEKRSAEYELFGVLMHSGTAVGGHYFAYIKPPAQTVPTTHQPFNPSTF